ncbi:2-hydroxyacid dehydrogenase [Pseudosulfitobacter pseudonitzschiae]|uniref:2-hydroxyacid dehydrogenase n=1 Tax=Pseudosulfitobacter pseudonitzschiae TaxID=1402135 RepID=UPI001AFAC817|nr:glyoxylate/hydroxypyruvate reductase A [Pseudosulfitobacter pseudonitzschiae]MBM1816063.1 glyoxylate/hydroxypyruvate reductase A [Pseudosulfitobacter pseudonitzschiae]MBM1833369.1 glyoxylate/hydroxypyruvate reductase A [Pseudosulfitobacter pseudonitzschiae]MBM1838236.1 glyoxylate/hydroxypyruvate reductase A [Pseudosulfitobacter pseudonitzschiae]MBM1842768.1 glyoxylate/hydroxypyruvate reductase A [Pseudosulfitobacter pseudonitzschiae]MBM1847634.1 glyoxylate/hydroxypyruvate reductase A [Pseud
MINVLFAAHPDRWASYETPLKQAIANAGVEANLATDIPPADVDYIVYAPNSPLQDFTPYTRAKAVLNLWAGVEKIVGNETLKIPLTRMVDPGLSQGMCEWVTGHTLRHHLGMDAHINCAPGVWKNVPPPLAWDRKVTVLGLGELGTACAQMLALAGFDVTGWSRSPKNLDGIRCLSGEEGLTKALTGAEIVVLLLPDTPATENTLNAETLALLARGACIINPGRGPLIDDDALLAALDTGQVGHATLDVFRVEPLPDAHPYWHHPRVTVTPHVAAETRPKYSALTIAENIRRGEAGAPFLHLVDRSAGY